MSATAGGARAPRWNFDPDFGRLTRFERACRNLAVSVFAVNFVLAVISGHRAIWQVQRLDVQASDTVLRPGTRLSSRITSSGRVESAVLLELAQGAHAERLALRELPRNRNAAMNPFSRHDSVAVVVTPALLARFAPGPAVLRAYGIGGMQWLRTPPDVIRELRVTLPPR